MPARKPAGDVASCTMSGKDAPAREAGGRVEPCWTPGDHTSDKGPHPVTRGPVPAPPQHRSWNGRGAGGTIVPLVPTSDKDMQYEGRRRGSIPTEWGHMGKRASMSNETPSFPLEYGAREMPKGPRSGVNPLRLIRLNRSLALKNNMVDMKVNNFAT